MSEVTDCIAIEPIEVILEHMRSEGFRPTKVADETLRMLCEGRSVWIETDRNDSTYYQVFAANIWELESAEEAQWAIEACNHVSSRMKMVKAYVNAERSNVWIEASAMYSSVDEFIPVSVRLVELVRVGVTRFVDKMRELRNSTNIPQLH